jgi:hypothetical protein
MLVWSLADGLPVRFDGARWSIGALHAVELVIGGKTVIRSQQSPIADPDGGTSVDGPARQAISAILQALREHGLIAV